MKAEPVPMTKEYKDAHFCEWTYDDSAEGFETGCSELFCFTADGIKENGFIFCPYCGRVIKESVIIESHIDTSAGKLPFDETADITAEEDTARAKAHQAGDGLA